MSEDESRAKLLQSVSQEEFDELSRRPLDSIIAALKQGDEERESAEIGVDGSALESNFRFAVGAQS